MGYNLDRGDDLNFGKGRHIPLQPFVPEGKSANYYDRTCRGLGFVTPSSQSESKSDESLPSQSSESSNWNSNISVWVVFKKLYAKMTFISQAKQGEDIVLFDTDLWTQQLDLQWEKCFEQRESLTKDKVIQVDVGGQTHLKLIFISESLSPTEKKDLISLIREYMDVFAWSYEEMSGLDSQVAMHHLNINQMPN